VLQIWLPPEFDPGSGTPAGDVLQAHLDEFARRRAGVRIEVRVKAVDMPGGLLDALTSASAAAPLILPDLIALPRSSLEAAALKGLLHPYEGLSTALEHPDWYEYARKRVRIQASTYGLPFAGDARVLVYRPEAVAAPPTDWQDMLELTGP
jgi:maltose-binding protein MalE